MKRATSLEELHVEVAEPRSREIFDAGFAAPTTAPAAPTNSPYDPALCSNPGNKFCVEHGCYCSQPSTSEAAVKAAREIVYTPFVPPRGAISYDANAAERLIGRIAALIPNAGYVK